MAPNRHENRHFVNVGPNFFRRPFARQGDYQGMGNASSSLKKLKSPPPLPIAILREIAVAASVDPVSLRKALQGGVVRGLAGYRIRGELERRGLLYMAPALAAVTGAPTYVIDRVGMAK